MKRVIVATLSGVLFGLVCFGLAYSSAGLLPWPVTAQIIVSRTLIGVAIGASSLSLGHWSVHGAVMGLVFSLPLAFSGLMAPDSPEYSKAGMWALTVLMGVIYGVLIEVITSVVFKAPQER